MSAAKKYALVKSDFVLTLDGRKLYRIKAKTAIVALGIAAGTLGGYIESEKNLAQVSGDAWVSGDAHVYGDARVSGDAHVSGNALVSGDARVSGDAHVYGDARVSGDAHVYGNAQVYGPIVTATRTDGYTFLVAPTPQGPRIIAGCRYFTFEHARAHWTGTRGGTRLGDESLALVDHLERMATICGFLEPIATEELA